MSVESPVSTVAAIDLGSNSFHMVIARLVDGRIEVVDRLREPVRLAAGLTDDKRIDPMVQDRALQCLQRFGERLRNLPKSRVRAVGTNTLRKAGNSGDFMARAFEALGHKIDVIPGREEARLIYLGVMQTTEDDSTRRLVVDIGGGSTECIIGEALDPLEADSMFMGCVRFSRLYFADGRLKAKRFRAAENAARLELQSIQQRFRRRGWDIALGASGTIKAIDDLLRINGWSEAGITLDGMRELERALVRAGRVERLDLPGLDADRKPVIAGGLTILLAVFEALKIEQMTVSAGALRDGLLYDLLGRIQHNDLRDQTIQRMVERYAVDVEQAERVRRSALALLDQVGDALGVGGSSSRRLLGWAGWLHEIGLAVNHGGYHKHGAYLVANGNMPGFSRDDMRTLAAIIRTHRRKILPGHFSELSERRAKRAQALSVILRFAVLLNRSRKDRSAVAPRAEVKGHVLVTTFPDGWLDDHPLTQLDLTQEARHLLAVGYKLKFGPCFITVDA